MSGLAEGDVLARLLGAFEALEYGDTSEAVVLLMDLVEDIRAELAHQEKVL